MKLVITTILLIFCTLQLYAIKSQSDSLVLYEDLTFQSDGEQFYFNAILKNDNHIFEAFYLVDGALESELLDNKSIFYSNLLKIRSIKKGKNSTKYLKNIYNEVHSRFLRKYEEIITFDRIFKDGWYNCVTACSLYGQIFDELEIPYTIKETPTHVYIIAYPDSEQIVIETTDPVGGFKDFNETFKRSFIKLLKDQKMIESNDNRSLVDQFNEHYYSANEIDLTKLLGIQYFNSGLSKFSENSYTQAKEFLKKAYFLYQDSEKIRQTLLAVITQEVAESNYAKLEEVKDLAFISRFNDFDLRGEIIKDEFYRITQNQLINKNDTLLYRKSYKIISNSLVSSDSLLKEEVSFIFNYEMSRILHNRGYYEKAYFYAKRAYEGNPSNLDSENLLVSCYSNSYKHSNSSSALDELTYLVEDHPNLKHNNRVGGIWLNLHLVNMYDCFLRKEISNAFRFKSKFENLANQNPGYQFDQNIAGSAYSQVVVYYFRKGQYSNARKALNKGFKYAPNNHELETRSYMLN